MFCVSFLKERDCSLRLTPREQDRSERNAWSLIPAPPGGGARSNAVTRTISWREVARSNQRRGNQAVNTTEINAAWMNNRLLTFDPKAHN
jgi:hypothetical protein